MVPAPPGASIANLPPGHATVTLGGTSYHYHQNTFYRATVYQGATRYVVVTRPQGVVVLKALPAEFDVVETGQAAYFVHDGNHHLPFLDITGEEVYIEVDKPQQKAQTPSSHQQAASSERVSHGELTVKTGTMLSVRLANDLDSGVSATGDRFQGYLDDDLMVGELLAATRGSKVYGLVVEAKKAGRMKGKGKLVVELTDIELGGQVLPIYTAQFKVEGQGSKTGRKIAGATIGAMADGEEGAGQGAAVGATAGLVTSAATKGKQVRLPAQSPLEFRVDRSFVVGIPVKTT